MKTIRTIQSMGSPYSSRTVVLLLARYLWPPSLFERWYVIATMLYSLVVVVLHATGPIVFKSVVSDFEQGTAYPVHIYSKLVAYGFIISITHLTIEQMLILKPLQRGMHAFSQDLIFAYYQQSAPRKSVGTFLNELKLAQRGFNDFFWDLFFYCIPVCIQTIITMIILGITYSAFYPIALSVIIIAYTYACLRITRWTIATRKAYNHHDSYMISFLAATTKDHATFQSDVTTILHQRYTKALQKDFRDCYARCLLWGIIGLGLMTLLIAAGHGVLSHTLSLADFITIKSYTLQTAFPLLRFGNIMQSMQKSLTNIEHSLER